MGQKQGVYSLSEQDNNIHFLGQERSLNFPTQNALIDLFKQLKSTNYLSTATTQQAHTLVHVFCIQIRQQNNCTCDYCAERLAFQKITRKILLIAV